MTVTSSQKLPDREIQARAKLLADQHGATRAAKILGVTRESFARLCGGLRIYRGTLSLVTQRFAQLDAAEASELAEVDRVVATASRGPR